MKIRMPELPYALEALEPHISRETLEYHYGKHHKGYFEKLTKLLEGNPLAEKPLEEILKRTSGSIYDNAAQLWNHDFYWHCLTPTKDLAAGANEPKGQIADLLKSRFGSVAKFKEEFTDKANGLFGSGWAWLVQSSGNKLEILTTHDGHCPITDGQKPLLACDVWEHAYYIDHRNERAPYLEAFWKLANWDFVATRLAT